MRNHIHHIEMLPISASSRAIARANYDAAEASIDRIVRALAWLRECSSVSMLHGGKHDNVRRGAGVDTDVAAHVLK